ncbi:hypothetical protein WA1_12865 [Scytonema hofmannii PCC 7110]|uniref:Uncharacterized protein n=1 Tax=Scytonema hofmannii PCC 7110 TaxID=128403 RepID=A0A139XE71_9CYAN|nr:hypothetical protein WA1_12865 [Scytonema hofmannii PCC 7110]
MHALKLNYKRNLLNFKFSYIFVFFLADLLKFFILWGGRPRPRVPQNRFGETSRKQKLSHFFNFD